MKSKITKAHEYLKFDDFMKISNYIYLIVGMEPFREDTKRKKSKILPVVFYAGLINLNLCLLCELIYLASAIKSASFLEVTALAPCMGGVLVSNFKMLSVWWNKNILESLIQDIIKLYPKNIHSQIDYDLIKCENEMLMVLKPFSVIYFILACSFNFLPLFDSVLKYYMIPGSEFEYRIPFLTWYPFDVSSNKLTWILTYIHQIYAGFIAVTGIISADILLCVTLTQVLMHFNYIAKSLKNFVPNKQREQITSGTFGNSKNQKFYRSDVDFLKEIIRYHNKILEMVDKLNIVFSISILFNFLASSVIICLVGFQAITGANRTDLFKYLIFLISSMMQILVICYFGNRLIDSSENIGYACYDQDWTNATISYKKMLVMIIRRSQRPSYLNAITFPPISLLTFNKVIAMSYQFFALLRTMYSNK